MVSVSVREWKSMVGEAVEVLGEPWEAAGSGRHTVLTPGGCGGWWMSYVYLEPTSIGKLVAHNAFTGRALVATLTGDGGGTARDLKFDGPRRDPYEWLTPEGLVVFAEAANEQIFATNPDVSDYLITCEEAWTRWVTVGRPEIVSGPGRQLLVVLRVICQSRPREELIASVDWVLEEDLQTHPPISAGKVTGPDIGEFFTQMRSLLVADDRPGVEELILATRAQSLAVVGIRNTGNPVFPKAVTL